MNDNLRAALKLLVRDYYITAVGGKLQVSNKLFRVLETIDPSELSEVPSVVQAEPGKIVREVIRVSSKSKLPIPKAGQSFPLVDFIKECGIPRTANKSDGTSYMVCKYSKEAEQEFLKIIAAEYQRDILVAATKLYYKSTNYPETISNYIIRGTWVTHYQDMESNLIKGTAEKHIKDTVIKTQSTGGFSDDR